ncbi:MAG: hypothetical protein NVS3B10_29200 [Polyangiales bacterium]
MPSPTVDDLDEICALDEPVLRHLLITQRYHDLSAALRQAVDPDGGSNATWSTFATWASKTAGQTIRSEEVPRAVSRLVADATEVRAGLDLVLRALSALHPTHGLQVPDLLAPIEHTIRDLGAQIALGNLKVFRELAPIFARFARELGADPQPDPARLDRFVGALDRPVRERGGQALLREAFTGYYQARFERDAERRAQQLLACNCLIGLHEQSRLQPQIAGALDAPIDDTLRAGVDEAIALAVPHPLGALVARAIEVPLAPVIAHVEVLWRRIATRYLMNLTLPLGAELPLGRDIQALPGDPPFPPTLQRISGPPGLLSLIGRYDRASLVGSREVDTAAVDWADLDQRMNFILNLFRSRQQDATLFEPPFDAAQRADLDARRVPASAL